MCKVNVILYIINLMANFTPFCYCHALLDTIEYIVLTSPRNPIMSLVTLSYLNSFKLPVKLMSNTKIGFCEIELYLPGVLSLKQKRGILKSMLNKMRNKFNVANAEVGNNDSWQSATIAITTVSNSATRLNQTIQNVMKWIESNYPDAMIVKHDTEIL